MVNDVSRATARFEDDRLTKLMAQENLTIQVVPGAKTASFDVVSRVLVVPDWDLSKNQSMMLKGHEVGHALNTDESFIESLVSAKKQKLHAGLKSYINIVEDARIERLMREAYPGMKETFYEGYREFSVNGPILQVAGRHYVVDGNGKKHAVADMKLIDRINMFYKLGAWLDVPFAEEERKWIPLIDKAWSTERAVEIAKELHELAKDEILEEQQQRKEEKDKRKEQQKDKKNQQQQEPGEPGEPGEPEESEGSESGEGEQGEKDSDGDESESDSGDDTESGDDADGTSSDSDDDSSDGDGDDSDTEAGQDSPSKREDLDPTSETDQAISEGLKALAGQSQQDPDQEIRHLLLKPLSDATVKARTVTAEDWSNRVNAGTRNNTIIDAIETKWNDAYLPTAKMMAQEFLQKKTAKNMLHARTGKTGRLDMNKLSKYKFAEDIFKHVTTVPNGQSHGIVMLIDGSSSMSEIFGSVLDQVLLFAHFAYKTNIPFECYMFTTNGPSYQIQSTGFQTVTLPNTGTLVGLINTAQRASFRNQVRAVLTLRAVFVDDDFSNNVPFSSLGGTPLYAGMMLMERHVERMKRTLRLDKVMSVVISDGEDNGGLLYETRSANRYTGNIETNFERVNSTAIVVRDTVTMKNHVLVSVDHTYGQPDVTYSAPDNAIMTLLFDVLKSRHGCRNIYLYLTENGFKDAVDTMTRADVTSTVNVTTLGTVMREQRQFVLPASEAMADCAMVVNPTLLALTEGVFQQWLKSVGARQVTSEAVVKNFIASTAAARANRVFINAIMPTLI